MGQKSGQGKKTINRTSNTNVNSFKPVNTLDGFNCLYANADSLPNKLDELKVRIQESEENLDIICITEVYPKNCRYLPTKSELQLQGYEMFLNEGNSSRGTAIYLSDKLKGTEVKLETNFKESIWVNVKLTGADKLLIGCIYKSPNSDTNNLEALNELLVEVSNLKHVYTHLLILGDFNFPKIDWNTHTAKGDKASEQFIESVRDGYLYQHVDFTTRARIGVDPSVLDLIFTNDENMIDDIQINSPLGHSDHSTLTFKYKCYSEPTENKSTRWNYFKGDYDSMERELDIKWDEILLGDDPDPLTQKFMEIFNEAKKKFIPKVKSNITRKARKHNYMPLDEKVVRKIKKKHRCWQRFMETRDGTKHKEYAKMRNQVKGLVRKAKREMEKDIAKQAKTDPKKFWQYANAKRKTKSGISDLKYKEGDEEKIAEEDTTKANVLADFFSSVFTIEPDGEAPTMNPIPTQYPCEDRDFNCEEITKLLLGLEPNKSQGPDEIHPFTLKKLARVLNKPLEIIYNASLHAGRVPKTWKSGNITAIFKKGSKSDPGNYRPVSLTSVICKLMEKLIRAEVVKHMEKNKLFSKKQFGFLKGRSTTLQLLKVLDEWTEILDNGGTIDVVYMDFMKAFDKVPHRRLINKLKSYGISNQLINWIANFLNERNQTVKVNGSQSSTRPVTSGIPQGSVLGPILFVIYINDMPECVTSSAYLFADDTKVSRQISNDADVDELQKDLDSLHGWSNKWLLKFHPNKCKIVTISNRRQAQSERQYHLYNDKGEEMILERSEGEKDIGVLVDKNLTFTRHMQQQVNKANSIMGLIRRTYTYLDEISFKYLFQALVRPHLEYAEAVWNPYLKKYIQIIENVQKRATKQVHTLSKMNYSERLKKLKLPTLKYRRLRGDMIETYKIISGIYDTEVTNGMLEQIESTRTRGHSYKLKKNQCRLNVRKYNYTNRIVDVWNSLPEKVVTAKTVKQFEIRLDRVWEDQEMKYVYTEPYETGSGNPTLEIENEEEADTVAQIEPESIEVPKVS